ncbi:hypothetical protein C8J55DRAFT_35539 [Lentinula edodes]|uniref:Uncharacterized protein n=1 Tax=Lentinula lateritia TaxID=40482 RepID=A0A9W9DT56_9AGAR|nr:hypothetical protein C8J55DRAFT_35539 [Lentinula edodes]
MPPPIEHPCLHLHVLPDTFFVSKLGPIEPVPQSIINHLINNSRFLSLTRTPEETSIVGQWHDGIPAAFEHEAVWRCIKLQGPMEFCERAVKVHQSATYIVPKHWSGYWRSSLRL